MKKLKIKKIRLLLLLFSIVGFSQPVKIKSKKMVNEVSQQINGLKNLNCPIGYKEDDKSCILIVETNQGIDKRWTPIVPKPSKESYSIKDGMVGNVKILLNVNEVNERLLTLMAKVYSIKKTEIRFYKDKPVLYCLATSYQINAEQVLTIPLKLEKGIVLLTSDLVTMTITHKGVTTTRTEANTAFQQNDYIGHVTLLK